MHSVNDLSTVKQESAATQWELIDNLISQFETFTDPLPPEILADGVTDLSRESKRAQLQYEFCAVIAADIATVPYVEGRAAHLAVLQQVADHYNLSLEKIIYLSRYAELRRCRWRPRGKSLRRRRSIYLAPRQTLQNGGRRGARRPRLSRPGMEKPTCSTPEPSTSYPARLRRRFFRQRIQAGPDRRRSPTSRPRPHRYCGITAHPATPTDHRQLRPIHPGPRLAQTARRRFRNRKRYLGKSFPADLSLRNHRASEAPSV